MSKTICFLLKAKQPTDAQLQAGNYPKKKLAYRGLTITIENPAGSSRSGKDRDGHEWTTHMKNDYGYINRTEGVDGDHVDCYIGPDDSAESVYIVHQRKAGDWKSYDEDKAMLGFESEQEATQAYLKHYDDPRFLGPVTSMPFNEFKEKVLATMEKPAMIKSQIVFEKSLVQPHLRRMKTGRVVSVGGYENNRSKQVELTPEEKARQGDLLAVGDTVTESRAEMIREHEHLVDVLNSPSHEDDKAEAKKQAAELAEYKGAGVESWDPESAKVSMTRDQFVDATIAQIKAKREARGERPFTGFMGDTENDFRRDAGIAWDRANSVRNDVNRVKLSKDDIMNHDAYGSMFVEDEDGNRFRIHSARQDYAVAHPVVNGAAQVSADTAVKFHLNPETASAYPERNHSQLYRKLSPSERGEEFSVPKFDSDSWNKARDEKIAQSREAGYTHLDKLEPTVEAMRGKRIQYVHDNKVTGVIRTVDNSGNVYVDWSDEYSADKEMASPARDGKRTVMRSSLGRGDLKDYRVRPSKIVVRASAIN